jgi:hypothetical protein
MPKLKRKRLILIFRSSQGERPTVEGKRSKTNASKANNGASDLPFPWKKPENPPSQLDHLPKSAKIPSLGISIGDIRFGTFWK